MKHAVRGPQLALALLVAYLGGCAGGRLGEPPEEPGQPEVDAGWTAALDVSRADARAPTSPAPPPGEPDRSTDARSMDRPLLPDGAERSREDGGEGGADAVLRADASIRETNRAPAGKVSAFVAIGRGGRRLMSCDDGRTWRGEQKVNDSNEDHAPWSSMGVTYGAGAFLALYGWFGGGSTAHVLRSTDGLVWRETLGGAETKAAFGNDIVFGADRFVVNAVGSSVHLSADGGHTWKSTRFGPEFGAPILRAMLFLDTDPGRFFAWGDGGRAILSEDLGRTWRELSIPCGNGYARASAAFGGGVLLLSGPEGICRSVDHGRTWTKIPRPAAGHLLWTGRDFYLSSLREAYRSGDGISWTTVKTVRPATGWIAVAAVNPVGTFVAADETGTHFYRSTDGVSWTQQDKRPGTRITEIAAGFVEPSVDCPVR